MIAVRSAGPDDRDRIAAFLEEHGMRHAARLGELHDPVADEAFLGEGGGNLIGVLTYGIPLHDELVLERRLRAGGGTS